MCICHVHACTLNFTRPWRKLASTSHCCASWAGTDSTNQRRLWWDSPRHWRKLWGSSLPKLGTQLGLCLGYWSTSRLLYRSSLSSLWHWKNVNMLVYTYLLNIAAKHVKAFIMPTSPICASSSTKQTLHTICYAAPTYSFNCQRDYVGIYYGNTVSD